MFDTQAHSSIDQSDLERQPTDLSQHKEHPYLSGGGRDILIIIFYLIQNTSPKTLKSLALVSRDFRHLADYVRHRSLVLALIPPKLQASYDRLKYAEKHQLLPAIQCLEINDPGEGPYHNVQPDGVCTSTLSQYHEFVTLLATLIPEMTGLKDLIWASPPPYSEVAPGIVLQALCSCPKVRLHGKFGWIPVIRTKTPHEERMQGYIGNANLYELDASFSFRRSKECIEFTQQLKSILLSSRGIRFLRINISQPRGGCVVPSRPKEYCGLGFVGDESLPPLEKLTLTNYPWGRTSDTSTGPPLPNSVGYPGEGPEMDHWAETFDWSCLQRLTTSYIDFALKVMPKLVSLREVDFQTHHSKSDIIRFYQECPTALESIGADRLDCVTLEGILRHGSALKKLRLHTVEGSEWSETAMNANSLRAIRDSCPLIEELFLDIPRNGDWPWDVLDILASFPRLRNLTICFELGLSDDGDPVKPYVTFKAVNTLYRYLRFHSPPGQTCKISRFHVYSGAPPPLGYGYPAPSAFWPKRNSTEFMCTLSERDDDAARGVFEVVCPKTSNKEGASKRDVKVARHGPTPRSEWTPTY